MAFPTVLSVTESTENGSSTNITVNYPATTAAGDLLLLLVLSVYDQNPANPTGFTSIAVDKTARVTVREADGTEGGGSFTVNYAASTGTACAAYMYRIQAGTWADSGTLTDDVKAAITLHSTAVNANPPSLTPGWTLDTLWVVGGNGWDYSAAPGAPTNYGNLDSFRSVFANMATARRELNAASEDPGAFTNTAAFSYNHAGVTVAVKPAGGGTAVKDIISLGLVAAPR